MGCCGPSIKKGDENLLKKLRIGEDGDDEEGTLENISIPLNKNSLSITFIPKDGVWKCKYFINYFIFNFSK